MRIVAVFLQQMVLLGVGCLWAAAIYMLCQSIREKYKAPAPAGIIFAVKLPGIFPVALFFLYIVLRIFLLMPLIGLIFFAVGASYFLKYKIKCCRYLSAEEIPETDNK